MKLALIVQTLTPSLQRLNSPSSHNPCLAPHHHTNISPPFSRDNLKLSRRGLTLRWPSTSFLLLFGANAIVDPFNFSQARADGTTTEDGDPTLSSPKTGNGCPNGFSTQQKAFFDVSIDGEPAGRVVVGLYGEQAPAGAARFLKLVTGAAGISYRRKEFVKIMPNYIQHGGVRSYGVDAEMAGRTGGSLVAETLVEEWQRMYESCTGTKNVAGSLGLVVRDPSKPPPNLKLVARGGKLEIDEEEVRSDPNGTEFVITTRDSPELDSSTLVIGRVVEGMEVVEKINKVKTVQENTSSPYFRVAKLIGDKRAVVAERGFNRPYSKIIITNCGFFN